MKEKQTHYLYIDILRIIAAFFVIFNHTGDNGFTYFLRYDSSSFKYFIALFFSIICKISVPLFFMISGALLLPKDDSVKKLIQRVMRITIALFIFSVLSYVQQIFLGNETYNLKYFFVQLIEKDWLNVFWYLYSYEAYLITLPFMRAMIKGMSSMHYQYLMLLVIIFNGIIPVFLYLGWQGRHHINYSFSLAWILGYYPLYPLLGHYIINVFNDNLMTKKKMIILWSCSIVGILGTIYVTTIDYNTTGQFSENYLMSFIMLNCLTVMLTLKKGIKNIKVSPWLEKSLSEMGACTFGIYLFHGLLLRMPQIGIWRMISPKLGLSDFSNTIIRCLEIMMIGGSITYILRKIPIVRKIF